MRVKFSPRFFAMACGAALCAHGLVAQTSIQLFPEVNTRSSLPNAGYPGGTESDGITPTVPNSFSTSTVNLTCSASPIVATLSGPLMLSDGSGPQYTAPTATPPNALQAGGNLLVDNNIIVTVSGNSNTPANVCPHSFDVSGEGIYNENCFNWSGYGAYATSGTYPPGALNGQDPDTFQIPGHRTDGGRPGRRSSDRHQFVPRFGTADGNCGSDGRRRHTYRFLDVPDYQLRPGWRDRSGYGFRQYLHRRPNDAVSDFQLRYRQQSGSRLYLRCDPGEQTPATERSRRPWMHRWIQRRSSPVLCPVLLSRHRAA